jgi:hypothetical protein
MAAALLEPDLPSKSSYYSIDRCATQTVSSTYSHDRQQPLLSSPPADVGDRQEGHVWRDRARYGRCRLCKATTSQPNPPLMNGREHGA